MTTKYAIRIQPDNLALIQLLSPYSHVEVTEDRERFFCFTIDGERTTHHDIMQKDCLTDYDDGTALRIIN